VLLGVILDEGALVDGAHAQLPLDGRNEGWPLEERAPQLLQPPRHQPQLTVAPRRHQAAVGGGRTVQSEHAHVLLAGALLGLHQPRRSGHAHDQAPCEIIII
jgi:hypothetical protein